MFLAIEYDVLDGTIVKSSKSVFVAAIVGIGYMLRLVSFICVRDVIMS